MRTQPENKPNPLSQNRDGTWWGKGREIYLGREIRPGSKELRSQKDLAVLPALETAPPGM